MCRRMGVGIILYAHCSPWVNSALSEKYILNGWISCTIHDIDSIYKSIYRFFIEPDNDI